MEIKIRKMKQQDLKEVFLLNKNELYYDCDLVKVKESWDRIKGDKHSVLYVATDCERVVGYIHAGIHESLCFSPMASILTLVVSANYQKNGIGKLLLEAVEIWARTNSCVGIRVLSNESREAAHYFYQACGYRKMGKQVNLKKYF